MGEPECLPKPDKMLETTQGSFDIIAARVPTGVQIGIVLTWVKSISRLEIEMPVDTLPIEQGQIQVGQNMVAYLISSRDDNELGSGET